MFCLLKFLRMATFFCPPPVCNDISTKLGPVARGQVSSSCLKSIKGTQPLLQCSLCRMTFHLNCFGDNHELSKTFRLCSTLPSECNDSCSNEDTSLAPKLVEIIKLRSLRLIHQNIQSLIKKIDELLNMVSELKSEIRVR